jgi:hypothetical protein
VTWKPSYVLEFLPVPTEVAYRKAPCNPEDIQALSHFLAANSHDHHETGEVLTNPRLVLLISHDSRCNQIADVDTDTGRHHPI